MKKKLTIPIVDIVLQYLDAAEYLQDVKVEFAKRNLEIGRKSTFEVMDEEAIEMIKHSEKSLKKYQVYFLWITEGSIIRKPF